ncbi:hypothetical protein NHQ30_008021 [Ciborinia camelliae]|nr:hypothetical protein NHQ30_008021 [Ciborinia camelliae]
MSSSGSSKAVYSRVVQWIQGDKASGIFQPLLPKYKSSSSTGNNAEQSSDNVANHTNKVDSLIAVYPKGTTAEDGPNCLDGASILKIYGVTLRRRSYEEQTPETHEAGSIGIWECPNENDFSKRHALGLAAQETFLRLIRNHYQGEKTYCITTVGFRDMVGQIWSWEDSDGWMFTLEVRELPDTIPEADQESERSDKANKGKAKA